MPFKVFESLNMTDCVLLIIIHLDMIVLSLILL